MGQDRFTPYSVVSFEATNICNANCVFCGYQYQERPRGIQSYDDFCMAADLFRAHGRAIVANFTQTVGDSLLDPRILDKVRYCKQVGFEKVCLSTNLIGLRSAAALIESGVDQVTVSMPEPRPEAYREIYRSNRFHRFRCNLDDLLAENRRCGYPVRVGLALRGPYSLLKLFMRNADLRRMTGQLKFGLHDVSANTAFDDWGGRIRGEDLPAGMAIRANRKKKAPCFMLRYPGVSWDNKLLACACRDLNADSVLVLGRVSGRDPEQLKKVELRIDDIVEAWDAGHMPSICKECKQYQPAKC